MKKIYLSLLVVLIISSFAIQGVAACQYDCWWNQDWSCRFKRPECPHFVVPEIPFGTIMSLFGMVAAIALKQRKLVIR